MLWSAALVPVFGASCFHNLFGKVSSSSLLQFYFRKLRHKVRATTLTCTDDCTVLWLPSMNDGENEVAAAAADDDDGGWRGCMQSAMAASDKSAVCWSWRLKLPRQAEYRNPAIGGVLCINHTYRVYTWTTALMLAEIKQWSFDRDVFRGGGLAPRTSNNKHKKNK